MESLSSIIKSSWGLTHGMKKWLWMHLLCPLLLILFVFILCHYSLTQAQIKALSLNPYLPMYGISLFLFAPFFCFALKTCVEKFSARPYMFYDIYAAIPSLWPAIGLAVVFIVVFYGVFALKVSFLPHIQSVTLNVLFQVVYDVIQFCVLAVACLSVALELSVPSGFVASLKKAFHALTQHTSQVLVLALYLAFWFVCLSVLNQMALSVGHLVGLIVALCSIIFYVYLIPYQLILIARFGKAIA